MFTRFRFSSHTFAAVIALASAPAFAQTAGAMSPSSAATSAAASADKKFVDAAAVGGMTEVKLGQLAVANGESPAVKTFGQHMVDDHTKAGDELAGIAKGKGIAMPTAPDAAHQKIIDKFGGLKGKDFDNAYWKQMLGDHKKTIALFESEVKSGKDPEMKSFASKTLPTVKMHLQMVQDGLKKKG